MERKTEPPPPPQNKGLTSQNASESGCAHSHPGGLQRLPHGPLPVGTGKGGQAVPMPILRLSQRTSCARSGHSSVSLFPLWKLFSWLILMEEI